MAHDADGRRCRSDRRARRCSPAPIQSMKLKLHCPDHQPFPQLSLPTQCGILFASGECARNYRGINSISLELVLRGRCGSAAIIPMNQRLCRRTGLARCPTEVGLMKGVGGAVQRRGDVLRLGSGGRQKSRFRVHQSAWVCGAGRPGTPVATRVLAVQLGARDGTSSGRCGEAFSERQAW